MLLGINDGRSCVKRTGSGALVTHPTLLKSYTSLREEMENERR